MGTVGTRLLRHGVAFLAVLCGLETVACGDTSDQPEVVSALGGAAAGAAQDGAGGTATGGTGASTGGAFASGGAAGGSADPRALALLPQCGPRCDAFDSAGCPAFNHAECLAECEWWVADHTTCFDELATLLECEVQLTAADFYCNTQGGTAMSGCRDQDIAHFNCL